MLIPIWIHQKGEVFPDIFKSFVHSSSEWCTAILLLHPKASVSVCLKTTTGSKPLCGRARVNIRRWTRWWWSREEQDKNIGQKNNWRASWSFLPTHRRNRGKAEQHSAEKSSKPALETGYWPSQGREQVSEDLKVKTNSPHWMPQKRAIWWKD